MGKMTPLSLCQSIPYSHLRDQSITEGEREVFSCLLASVCCGLLSLIGCKTPTLTQECAIAFEKDKYVMGVL